MARSTDDGRRPYSEAEWAEARRAEAELRASGVVHEDETLDAIHRGALLFIQRRRGYRFSVDALLLADFAGALRGEVADLGAGCGVIGLQLAKRSPGARVTAFELQESLAALATRNAALNGLRDRFTVQRCDLRQLATLPSARFAQVVANPPFFREGAAVPSDDEERALARHELGCTLQEVLAAGRQLLNETGRIALVLPASREEELLTLFPKFPLTLGRLRRVHPAAAEPAKLILVEGTKTAGEPELLPPLVLRDPWGRYTPEALGLYEG